MTEDYVVVGVIGPAHGLRGEVYVAPRTDEPERRFAIGASLLGVLGNEQRQFTVEQRKYHQGRTLIRFAGVANRTEAEALRGYELRCPTDQDSPQEPDEYYDHQLIGLEVVADSGRRIGTLKQVQHHAQDLLVITSPEGEVLVPFVQALVPEVDLAAGRIIVRDLPGLLDPQEG
ncbi:MAG TPA: ribosome maturation factor RimM [Marmoricola sp.]|nr:ribosome maturation factor RimM [Marmoricola sp.]